MSGRKYLLLLVLLFLPVMVHAQQSPTDELFTGVNLSIDNIENALISLMQNNSILERQLTDVSESLQSLKEYSAMREVQYKTLGQESDKLKKTIAGWRTYSIVITVVVIVVIVVISITAVALSAQ